MEYKKNVFIFDDYLIVIEFLFSSSFFMSKMRKKVEFKEQTYTIQYYIAVILVVSINISTKKSLKREEEKIYFNSVNIKKIIK